MNLYDINPMQYYKVENSDDVAVILQDAVSEKKGKLIDGKVYLDYGTVSSTLNKRFYWDATEQVLRYVTPEGLINVTPDTASYLLGKTAQTADHVIALLRDGEMYLSMSFVQKYTDIHG